MKGTNLGEFEELLLLIVLILEDQAYVLRIQEEIRNQVQRDTSMGALHASLTRLEEKGFLSSEMTGATAERGGRRKRIYQLSSDGKIVLNQVRTQRESLWQQAPKFSLDTYGTI